MNLIKQIITKFSKRTIVTAVDIPPKFEVDWQQAESSEQKYMQHGSQADLDEAAAAWRRICDHSDFVNTPEEFQLIALNNASNLLLLRYRGQGRLSDLKQAITILQAVIQRTAPDSPFLPTRLDNLGSAFLDLYGYTNHLSDLEEGIKAMEAANHDDFPDPSNLPTHLNNLAVALRQRYINTGQLHDLLESIRLSRESVNCTPSDSPYQAIRLSNLGNATRLHYFHTGQMDELEEAICVFQEAIRYIMPHSPYISPCLTNLGSVLLDRYKRTGQLADLNEAVDSFQAAIHASSRSQDLWGCLNNLATGLLTRYSRTGQLIDLEEAIHISRESVNKAPLGSPNLTDALLTEGYGLHARYLRFGQLVDLEKAIQNWQRATQKISANSPKFFSHLNFLGMGLLTHYEHTNRLTSLKESIYTFRQIIHNVSRQSPDCPLYMSGLGNGLLALYNQTGQLADLEEAIQLFKVAVDNTSSDSTRLSTFLNNLGAGLRHKYIHTGEPTYFGEAIRTIKMGIQCASPSSHELPVYYINLGNALCDHWQRLDADETKKKVIEQEGKEAYEQACRLGDKLRLGEVVNAARIWGRWALIRQNWNEARCANQYGLSAMEVLYRGQLLQQEQQSWQRKTQGLFAEAAYAQARQGNVSIAVALLEQGQARNLNERLVRDEADLSRVEVESPILFEQYRSAATRLRHLEAAERQNQLAVLDFIVPPDWAAHRHQVEAARADLDAAIVAIREIDGYDQFLQLPELADVVAAVRPGHSLAYLVTTLVGSLTLLLYCPAANAEVTIEPLWANDFTNDDLNAFLVKRENGEEPGGYLLGQFFSRPTLQTALAEGLPLLGETLLAPLAQRLEALDLQRVILIPGGRLNLLPLHAVTVTFNGQPAIFGDMFAVSYAPSARALSLSYHRSQDYEAPVPRLLTVGNPLPLPDGVRPLPYARLEAEEIARRFGQEVHLVCAEAATHAAIAAAMPGHTHLHFACHGQFDPEKPLESGLLLGGDTLTLRQIIDDITLRGVRLAVLSACQTAISDYKELPDEVIGLPAAFLQAGAAGVLGSLWPVNDLSTMLLMDRFYHLHLDEGVEAAIALQRAQRWLREVTAGELFERFGREVQQLVNRMSKGEALEYWRRFEKMGRGERPFADPYYWAAFTFTGA